VSQMQVSRLLVRLRDGMHADAQGHRGVRASRWMFRWVGTSLMARGRSGPLGRAGTSSCGGPMW
jgi:hypothetical protein